MSQAPGSRPIKGPYRGPVALEHRVQVVFGLQHPDGRAQLFEGRTDSALLR
jgi:hypothetical protein